MFLWMVMITIYPCGGVQVQHVMTIRAAEIVQVPHDDPHCDEHQEIRSLISAHDAHQFLDKEAPTKIVWGPKRTV